MGALPYFGSKRSTAFDITTRFPAHRIYYEPFLGGAAVLLAKPPAAQEAATDRNPDVLNLMRCLADEQRARWLFNASERWPLSESVFAEAAERLSVPFELDTTIPNMYRAFDFLLVSWQGPSGLAGTDAKPRFAKRNTASGGSLAARWRSVGPNIPQWHERLRSVEFRGCGGFKLIADAPDEESTLIYCDPPYHPDTRTGGNYAFEFTLEQHAELAEALRQFTHAKVVVSYRACPALDEMYRGWFVTDIAAPKRMKNAGSDATVESAGEILYSNVALVAWHPGQYIALALRGSVTVSAERHCEPRRTPLNPSHGESDDCHR